MRLTCANSQTPGTGEPIRLQNLENRSTLIADCILDIATPLGSVDSFFCSLRNVATDGLCPGLRDCLAGNDRFQCSLEIPLRSCRTFLAEFDQSIVQTSPVKEPACVIEQGGFRRDMHLSVFDEEMLRIAQHSA